MTPQSLYYNGDTLKTTINYTFDGKISAYKYLSNMIISYGPNNITGIASPDIIANGGVVMANGSVSMKFYLSWVYFSLYTSIFEYNTDNYPVKQTMNYTMKPEKIEVREFEYIQ